MAGDCNNIHLILLFILLLLSFVSVPAFGQDHNPYYATTSAAASSPLSPADMSASSIFASLATATPQQQSGEGGGPGESTSDGGTGNAGGASGSDTTSFSLSRGGMIAIIVVVAVVAIFGIVSSVLFYLAKKRSWEVRATIRRSAKRVATALTPRRSEFPSSVKQGRRSSKNMSRIDEIPPTPRIKGFDLEKGMKTKAAQMKNPLKPSSKWARKTDE